MAHRLSEPQLYSGFVISMIGQQLGMRIPMDYSAAQACVANGTARWDDDETPFDKGIAGEITKRTAEREAAEAADAKHGQAKKAKSVEQLLADRARKIVMAQTETGAYLARPFPQIVLITKDMTNLAELIRADPDSEGGDIIIEFANASAHYKPVDPNPDPKVEFVALELVGEADQFSDEIPADWKDGSHLKYIPIAKAIRRTTDKMTKDEAVAIIEEWTKPDDTIRAEEPGKPIPKGEGDDAGNRDKKDFNPEKAADEAAKNFASGDSNV